MLEGVVIAHLNEADTAGVIAFAQRLEGDRMPCSFWGLDQQAVQDLVSYPHKVTLVAAREHQIVGLGVLSCGQHFQRHLGELSVAVCPRERRQGIAGAIVRELVAEAHRVRLDVLKALIWTENLPSRQLFSTLGFAHRTTLYGEFKSAEFGLMDDCVYYKMLL